MGNQHWRRNGALAISLILLLFRPVHSDRLYYEPNIGRLRMAVRAASMVEFYRGVFGKVLFDDPTFFEGPPVCSLEVLQTRGRAALDHNVSGVGRIRMTECVWQRGDGNQHQIRSADCFREIEELRLPLSEGMFVQAKLKFEIIQKSARPVTVTIGVPSRIQIPPKSDERLIEKVLKAIGIRNPPPSYAANDLWSLYPWRHALAVWHMVFGSDADALIERGVLRPVQLAAVAPAEQPSAGRILYAHEMADGDFYATSDMPEIRSRSLSGTDIDGFELIPEQLRLYLRSRLGITAGGTQWQSGGDVLDLGIIEAGEQRIHAVYALRSPSAGIGINIRARANGAHPVLLNPTTQPGSPELAAVTLEAALPQRGEVVRGAIAACGLTNVVPALFSAPDDARLIVDTRLKKISIDGVEIKGLAPDSHPYRFIEFLARNPSRASMADISEHLSHRQDGDAAARRAKMDAQKCITEAMADAGRAFDEKVFPSHGTGFCRCALPPYVQ